MYLVGSLRDWKKAEEIKSHLTSQGIWIEVKQNQENGDDQLTLWVESEKDLQVSQEAFAKVLGLIPKNKQEVPKEWKKIWKLPYRAVTMTLIVLSLFIAIITKLGTDLSMRAPLLIESGSADGLLFEIQNGEIWRLVTPIFLHFGLIHLFFNLMWLKDLGRIVEDKVNTVGMILFVVLVAIFSNFLQYAFTGPNFGGMSGVVYALLALNFRMKGMGVTELAPGKSDLYLMTIWFFVCLTGWFGPVANMAHAGGLFLGLSWPVTQSQLRESTGPTKYQSFRTLTFIAIGALMVSIAGVAEYLKLGKKLYLISQ